jgi:hypothetical protein
MASVILQPMLHDPLGWKPSKSTYIDHYRWRNYRSKSKDQKSSIYGQRYQREMSKKSPIVYSTMWRTNNDLTVQPLMIMNRTQDYRGQPVTYRASSANSLTQRPPVYIVEQQREQRPASAHQVSRHSRSDNVTCFSHFISSL